ncbi:uncharacterized protein LOC134786405 [Penaeus indicus]|uniref:uncharacterized protein LOC125025991 n=1 Tax=Penaeus chinensis TaxID=139456 RepID=UPI001FB6A9AF|nr:uncharacterized protein LOC125025991 [Penaeus chinensis]
MHQVLLVLPLLLLALLVPAACFHVPSVESVTGRGGQSLEVSRDAVAVTPPDAALDPSRLRRALRALLDLNDGELQALMAGVPPHTMAPRIAPSTAFFLAGSRAYLERLQTILSTSEDTSFSQSTWNPKIARRRKKGHSARYDDEDIRSSEADESENDPDSILGALTELSAYLAGEGEAEDAVVQERSRRSHHGRGRKHQTQAHTSRQYETHHYLYYLRSGKCPAAADGHPKMFCPSPSDQGEWRCIEDLDLCDGTPQCPGKEDEAPTHCLFHNAMRMHLDELTKVVMFKLA